MTAELAFHGDPELDSLDDLFPDDEPTIGDHMANIIGAHRRGVGALHRDAMEPRAATVKREPHACPPAEVEWKFDAGRGVLLCAECRTIIGYQPTPSAMREELLLASVLRKLAAGAKWFQLEDEYPGEAALGVEGTCDLTDDEAAALAKVLEATK